MNLPKKTLAEITTEAFTLLNRELGVEDTTRFIDQYRNSFELPSAQARSGFGNYTDQRDALFGHLTLDEILQDVRTADPGDAG